MLKRLEFSRRIVHMIFCDHGRFPYGIRKMDIGPESIDGASKRCQIEWVVTNWDRQLNLMNDDHIKNIYERVLRVIIH